MMNTIEETIQALASGLPVLVADDEDRENEGDLIVAAEYATPELVNLFAREGRGLVCAALPPERAAALKLRAERPGGGPPALHGTAFTASVDYAVGTSTGISCADRSATLRALADPAARADDFARPGHVFPLAAKPDGVLERRGHTEAAVDLCRLAGLSGAAAICEVLRPDGEMARWPELQALAARLGIPLATVEALARYRAARETPVSLLRRAALPTRAGRFELQLFAAPGGGRPLALRLGPAAAGGRPPLVRVHSECLTGDAFGSKRCDCGAQLERAQELVAASGQGAVIYLRQEGRGVGLEAKLAAYALQEDGLDTVDANLALGLPADSRRYDEAAWILRSWGWNEIRLLTNNPAKAAALAAAGIRVAETIGLEVGRLPENEAYLETKRRRMGHRLAPANGGAEPVAAGARGPVPETDPTRRNA